MPDVLGISPEECRALLADRYVGRVAVCTPLGPHIVPVNFAVVADSFVVRTSPYSVLGGHAIGATLALEVDDFDHQRRRGWSVVARGRAEAVKDVGELQYIRAVCAPQAWASGQRNLYLRVWWDELSGRRLGTELFRSVDAAGVGS